jgi:hypothetical protein
MKRKIIVGWAVLASLFFLSDARAYDEVAVASGGTIRGVVKARGKIPRLPPLPVSKFKEYCKNVPDESLLARPDGALRYAVITLEGATSGKAVEREAVHELDNIGCRFVPHVQAATVGQFLVIKNSDPILHSVHAAFHNGQPDFNVGLFPGKVSRKPLIGAGLVKIVCEVHPWMISYIVVTEHPYHAVTDAFGEYEIGEVPPGRYRLKVWHERLGVLEKSVEVKGGAVAKVDFDLPVKEGVKK